jgi:hypothetical protein
MGVGADQDCAVRAESEAAGRCGSGGIHNRSRSGDDRERVLRDPERDECGDSPCVRCNLIRAEAYGSLNNSSVASLGTTSNVRLSRGMTANTNLFGNGSQAGSSATATIILGTGALTGYDLPNVSGSVTYAVQGSISNGGTLNFNTVQISAREIQI